MPKDRETPWQFVCPECGFGHFEIGALAADDEIHCLVCLEESDRHIVLHRWLAVEDSTGRMVLEAGLIAA